jgi:hypothetical protein
MTKFGDGEHNIANARTDVHIDFHSAGSAVRDPAWKVTPPCYGSER